MKGHRRLVACNRKSESETKVKKAQSLLCSAVSEGCRVSDGANQSSDREVWG